MTVSVFTEVSLMAGLPEELWETELLALKLCPLKEGSGEIVPERLWLTETEEDPVGVFRTE